MSVKLCLTRALYLWTSRHLCRLFRSTVLTSSGFGALTAAQFIFLSFLKCKRQRRARSQLRDVKHALWTLWHSSTNCFSRTYVHAVFKAALLNLSNTFCVRRAFRLKTHLAPFLSTANVIFKCISISIQMSPSHEPHIRPTRQPCLCHLPRDRCSDNIA